MNAKPSLKAHTGLSTEPPSPSPTALKTRLSYFDRHPGGRVQIDNQQPSKPNSKTSKSSSGSSESPPPHEGGNKNNKSSNTVDTSGQGDIPQKNAAWKAWHDRKVKKEESKARHMPPPRTRLVDIPIDLPDILKEKYEQAVIFDDDYPNFDEESAYTVRKFVEHSMPTIRSNIKRRFEVSDEKTSIVQIGACDFDYDSSNDPIQPLLKRGDVCAVLVEPVPVVYQRLVKNIGEKLGIEPSATSRIQAVNAAFCPEEGKTEMSFYAVNESFIHDNPDAKHWKKFQVGSFARQHLRGLRTLLLLDYTLVMHIRSCIFACKFKVTKWYADKAMYKCENVQSMPDNPGMTRRIGTRFNLSTI